MNIAFDLHGTIDVDPINMSNMMKALIDSNHNVSVMTGSEHTKAISELQNLDIYDYSEIYSIPEFLREVINVPGRWIDGKWYCEDDFWWKSKAMMCEYYKIDILIDNMKEYGQYLSENTKFILFDEDIDLNKVLIDFGVIEC